MLYLRSQGMDQFEMVAELQVVPINLDEHLPIVPTPSLADQSLGSLPLCIFFPNLVGSIPKVNESIT